MPRAQTAAGQLLIIRQRHHSVSAITQDGSRTRFSNRYQQTYHSHFGAQTESQQVFLGASGTGQRLCSQRPTSVLELGFGLGLNFLLTADMALTHDCPLRYVAFENDLIDIDSFLELDYENQLQHAELVESLRPVFCDAEEISRSTHVQPDCQLRLHRSDATQAERSTILESKSNSPASSDLFDAIYLDAFSPVSNPECWTLALFQRLHSCLKPQGKLTSYSVKGSVRRALSDAGFEVVKLPGPPGKREILQATALC